MDVTAELNPLDRAVVELARADRDGGAERDRRGDTRRRARVDHAGRTRTGAPCWPERRAGRATDRLADRAPAL